MKLDVYRSCSRAEKREVLNVYWHKNVETTIRIHDAAVQYGPWAIACIVILALELVPVIALSFGHTNAVGVVAVALEVFLLVSLWWAILRYEELRLRFAV
jgi:hypothetical protein